MSPPGAGARRPARWRRRVRRPPRGSGLGRGLRRLALLLLATGCAVEPPASPPTALPARPAPTAPAILSRFGDAEGAGGLPRPWLHSGIDIRVPTGTPVLAAADGAVLRAGWGPFAGRYVLLSHGSDLVTAYYHLSTIAVRAGQAVARGEPIGRAGMTGNASGPHLHFGACRRAEGCGSRIGDGWTDPEGLWADRNPCPVPGRGYPARPVRLTYPVPCDG